MRREYRGRQRNNNTKSFPYEPLVVGGRLVMPVELQRVHRAVLGGAEITEDACCGGEALARIGR